MKRTFFLLAALLAALPSPAQTGISIATSALPAGYVGSTYGYAPGGFQPPPRLAANIVVPGAVWSAQGNFPPGLTLASSGEVTGVPTRQGVFAFTVTLQTSLGSVSRSLSITVNAPPPLPPIPIPIGMSFRYKPPCAVTAATTYANSAALPSGVSFSPSAGDYTGSFATRDTYRTFWTCRSATQAYTAEVVFVIGPGGRRFVAPGFVGVPYRMLFQPAFGTPPVRTELVSGSLPGGLVLDPAARLISGTPNAAGTFRFAVRHTDGNSNFISESLEISVTRAFLNVTPTSLQFTGNSGASPSAPAALSLTGAVGQAYSATSSARWLAFVPVAGTLPDSLTVRADPGALPEGTHQATITIASPTLTPLSVSVTFRVGPPVAPKVSFEPSRLLYSMARGERSAERVLTIRNDGGGAPAVEITVPAEARSFVTVTPAQGVVRPAEPLAVAVSVQPGALTPGLYQTALRIQGQGIDLTVPVFLTVERIDRRLSLSQEGLLFRAQGTRAFPESDRISVIAQGGASPIGWNARAVTSSGAPWLRVRPSSGSSTPGQRAPEIEIAADPTGLAPGLHFGRIEVRSAGDELPGDFATVVLRVLPAASANPPLGDRSGFLFVAGQTAVETIRLFNPSDSAVTVSALASLPEGQSWLDIDGLGVIAPGDARSITIGVDATGLSPGIYSTELIFSFGEGAPVVRTSAALIVPKPARTAAVERAVTGCDAAQLKAVFTRLPYDFTSPVGLPLPVSVSVFDDCGEAVNTGSATLTFSNGDPALPLQSVGDGRWTGTWVPRGSVSRVTVTANVASAGPPALKASIQLSGSVESGSGVPVLAAAVSAVSFSSVDPLAPGAFLSILGSGLADGLSVADKLPLPVDLGGTRVFLNGLEVPLLFASDAQINAVIPFNLASDTTHHVFVMRNGALSANEQVPLAASQPAIFTKAGNGKGQALILAVTPESYAIAEPATPARPGQAIVIYCSGLGLTDADVDAGNAAPSSPLAQTKAQVTVTVGGRNASVFFAGLAPGYTSLYQVNAIVPAEVAEGDEVPVVVSAGGRSSPAVTIAVRR